MTESTKIGIFERFKRNLSELIKRHERLKEENNNLIKEKQILIEQLKEKEEKIKELENKIEIIKLGNAFILAGQSKDGDLSKLRHEAKIKINQIIKEVDICLTLLSKTK